jgi:hypothetical protein
VPGDDERRARGPGAASQSPPPPRDSSGAIVSDRGDLDLAEAAWRIAVEFPDAEVDLPIDIHAAAGLWAGRVWGRAEGWACMAIGEGGHHGPAGKYEFTSFRHRFHRWPDQARRLFDEAHRAAPEHDVYVIPLLRRTRSARKGTALAGRVAWADVDGPWTPDRAAAVDRLRSGGARVWEVASGSGRHVYLELDDPEPPDRLEAWNRRLGALLGGDAKWAENSLLRLPGTFNHKPRRNRKVPTPVRWCP